MHTQSTASLRCQFGLCVQPASRTVETRSPIGRRREWLCDRHATRRAELEPTVDQPIPFVLTAKGRTAIASVA